MLVIALATHVAHEEQHFQRFDVGAGGDHVHGHSDARVVVVAKAGQDAVGVFLGAVGHLFAEGVALAIDLAHDVDDVVGVAVGLGKDEGLGGFLARREDLRFHGGFHGLDDLADLARVDHRFVQLFARVGAVFFSFGPALFARGAVAVVHPFFGFQLGALLGDFGDDLKHVVADVHAIGHGVLVAVLRHDVLVEEAEGALVGRGGEADQAGVKIIEHLLPQVVDAAVAFVDDDEVEGFNGHGRVVADELFLGLGLLHLVERNVFGRFVDGLTAQDGIHALDGADAHLRMRVDVGRCQALHVVELGELARVVGRLVGHEFLVRLLAQVAGVHQKQNALGPAKFQQAVHRGDGGKGFARAGGHVHQGAGFVLRQRLLQPGDGAHLAVAQIFFWQGGHVLCQAAAQGVGLRQPCRQGLRLEEVKNFTRAWCGVGTVGKADDLAGGLEQKAQRGAVFAPLERGVGVARGLGLGDGEVFTRAVALGLDHAHGVAIDEQHIVRRAAVGGVFAHGHARRGAQVELLHVLNDPARLLEFLVYVLAGFGFRCHACLPPFLVCVPSLHFPAKTHPLRPLDVVKPAKNPCDTARAPRTSRTRCPRPARAAAPLGRCGRNPGVCRSAGHRAARPHRAPRESWFRRARPR